MVWRYEPASALGTVQGTSTAKAAVGMERTRRWIYISSSHTEIWSKYMEWIYETKWDYPTSGASKYLEEKLWNHTIFVPFHQVRSSLPFWPPWLHLVPLLSHQQQVVIMDQRQNPLGCSLVLKLRLADCHQNQGGYDFLVGGWTNTSEKYARQIGSSPQVGLKIKIVSNHHLVVLHWHHPKKT